MPNANIYKVWNVGSCTFKQQCMWLDTIQCIFIQLRMISTTSLLNYQWQVCRKNSTRMSRTPGYPIHPLWDNATAQTTCGVEPQPKVHPPPRRSQARLPPCFYPTNTRLQRMRYIEPGVSQRMGPPQHTSRHWTLFLPSLAKSQEQQTTMNLCTSLPPAHLFQRHCQQLAGVSLQQIWSPLKLNGERWIVFFKMLRNKSWVQVDWLLDFMMLCWQMINCPVAQGRINYLVACLPKTV